MKLTQLPSMNTGYIFQFSCYPTNLSLELRIETKVDDWVDADRGLGQHVGDGQHGVGEGGGGLVA